MDRGSFGALRGTWKGTVERGRIEGTIADFGAELDVDLRVADHASLGAVFTMIVPLSTVDGLTAGARGGVYYSGLVIPLPLLRFVAAF